MNRQQPHVLVLPEDVCQQPIGQRLQVLPVAGGWRRVLDSFESDHIMEMDKYPCQFMVLLIDFDGGEDRLNQARAVILGHLIDRVFVLGVWTEPEALRANLGLPYETIGRAIAKDCREETDTIWGMNSFDTTQVSLSAYASAFGRSCSGFEEPRLFIPQRDHGIDAQSS